MGKSNQAANALSHHPKSNEDNYSNAEIALYECISHATVCNDCKEIIESQRLPITEKHAIQNKSIQNQQVPIKNKVGAHSEMVDVQSKVSVEMMERPQEEDIDISQIMC